MAYTLFELPVTSDIGTNNVTPLALTPCDSPCKPRGWLPSLDFHCISKPCFNNASTEILSSARIHDVRSASPKAVSHWEPPRPGCVKTTVLAKTAQTTTVKRLPRIDASDIYLATP